jgi:hypothetical protein
MDFKGHFPFGGAAAIRSPCWTTTPVSLVPAHCTDERRQTVQQQLVSVFERYGLPERMTMDNGAPWGDTTGTWTALELWLMRLVSGWGTPGLIIRRRRASWSVFTAA